MTRYALVVAALLLTTVSNAAAAAELESPEHKSKNAQKVFAVLGSIGFNNKQVRDFVDEVDSHVDKNFVNFAERKLPGGGKLKLRYNMGPRFSEGGGPNLGGRLSTRRFELSFQPSDTSHFEYTAGPTRIMVKYHLDF